METKEKSFDLPYFDYYFQGMSQAERERMDTLMGRNVHWGYWENPEKADTRPAHYQTASDDLTKKLLERAVLKSGQRILDAGCGFGGTLALVNELYKDLDLTGLNIDARQIEKARTTIELAAKSGNKIQFVVGDACKLPFLDQSFDCVTAVECIFHFPSREDFFREAFRVLKPGGKLVLCDFIVRPLYLPLIGFYYLIYHRAVHAVYGGRNHTATLGTYRSLAKKTGFEITAIEDVTANTVPTYDVIRTFCSSLGEKGKLFQRANTFLEIITKIGAQRYDILAFNKPV